MRFVLILLGSFQALGASGAITGKIGYGSSTASMSTAYQENVFMGFSLGIEKVLGAEKVEKLLLIRQNNDKSISGASSAAQSLIQDGAVFLVGFPVSHDALLAADVAKKNGVFGLFGSPSHTALAEKGPWVYSTGASLSTLLGDLCSFLKERFPGQKGMSVVNPRSVFSMNSESTLRTKTQGDPGIQLETVRVTDALVLSDADLARLKKGDFGYLHFSVYPDDLVGLMNQLILAKVDIPIVAFGGPHPDVLRRYMSLRKSPYYIGTTWIPSPEDMKELSDVVRRKYHKDTNWESVIGYNLGLVTGMVVKRIQGPLTAASVAKAFNENRCYPVLGKQELCFGPSGGHAQSKNLRFMRFTEAGVEGAPAKP